MSGTVWFDRNGNGMRDAGEPLMASASVIVKCSQSVCPGQLTTSDGRYQLALPAGNHTIEAGIRDPALGLLASGIAPGPFIPGSPVIEHVLTVTNGNVAGVDFGLTLPPPAHDNRYFPQTGYRIDDDNVWDYFSARGGVQTFGYPVSRTFPFQGCCVVQFFQRQVIQLGGAAGGPHELNILDPGIMPINSVNFSRFPDYDAALARSAPGPSPDYGSQVITFVQQHAMDSFDGQPVDFYKTFLQTVSLQAAFPGSTTNAALLPLLNLEIWGVPTSQPSYDPTNHNFVYLRFQRGIMHFDAGCRCTEGILLADTFKAVITGQNLPADVAGEMSASQYLRAYDPSGVNGTSPGRPVGNLSYAFVPE